MRFQNLRLPFKERDFQDRQKEEGQVKNRGSLAVKWIGLLMLLICLCVGNLVIKRVIAQAVSLEASKVSEDLRELARGARGSARVRVIIQHHNLPDAALEALLQASRISMRA